MGNGIDAVNVSSLYQVNLDNRKTVAQNRDNNASVFNYKEPNDQAVGVIQKPINANDTVSQLEELNAKLDLLLAQQGIENPQKPAKSSSLAELLKKLSAQFFDPNRQNQVETAPQGFKSKYTPDTDKNNILDSSASNTPTTVDLTGADATTRFAGTLNSDDTVAMNMANFKNRNIVIDGNPNYFFKSGGELEFDKKGVNEVFNPNLNTQVSEAAQGDNVKNLYTPDEGQNNVLKSSAPKTPTKVDLTKNDPKAPFYGEFNEDDTIYITEEGFANPNFSIKGNPKIVVLSNDNVEAFQQTFAQEQEHIRKGQQVK